MTAGTPSMISNPEEFFIKDWATRYSLDDGKALLCSIQSAFGPNEADTGMTEKPDPTQPVMLLITLDMGSTLDEGEDYLFYLVDAEKVSPFPAAFDVYKTPSA